MSDTDWELLARYARHRTEDAFAEIVRRHVDLVHSAALRQVRLPQLAEEVAQSTFLKLAQHAGKLAPGTILSAWLYQVTRREAIDVVRRETRRQLREQIATQMNAMNAVAADWTEIEPLLDEAMHALGDIDRAAVLLRYFENKSLREVGAALGTTEDAARKRVTRAVECLREFFAKRGVTVGASGLVVLISANAIHAAPIGLVVTISKAATLVGAAIVTTTSATATKALAMTTMQKTLIAATLVAAVGTGMYEARQASRLRGEVRNLQQQPAGVPEQIQQMTRERDNAANQFAALQGENERLNRNTAELLRLRGQVGMLRQQTNDLEKRLDAASSLRPARPEELQAPSQITELVRAKQVFVSAWLQAFFAYSRANLGQCPETFQQAARFLPESIREVSTTAEQFEILYRGSLDAIKDQDIIVLREKELWQHVGGKWGRFYGIADGHAQYCSSSDKTATGSFENYEKPRLVQSSNQ